MGFINTVITLILLAGLCVAENSPEEAAESIAIKTPEEALQKALDYTGFGATKNIPLSKATTLAKQVIYHDDRTPFLSDLYDGQEVWCVTIDSIYLRLEHYLPEVIEENPKDFEIYIEPVSGKLLRIISPYYGNDPNIRPPVPAKEATRQLKEQSRDVYHSYPDSSPGIPFYKALEGVVFNCPPLAKEISAVFVIYSWNDEEPRPTWIISLRGTPPMPSFTRWGKDRPICYRNHWRTVVDAKTGAHLGTNNSPKPSWPEMDEHK